MLDVGYFPRIDFKSQISKFEIAPCPPVAVRKDLDRCPFMHDECPMLNQPQTRPA